MMTIIAYDAVEGAYHFDIALDRVPSLITPQNNEHWHIWIDVMSDEPSELKALKETLALDDYLIEDCLHPRQHAKLESFADYHFFIVHGLVLPEDDAPCQTIELNCFLGDRFLVTHHEQPIESIENTLRRAHLKNSRISQGTAYLAYEILDQLIDMFMPLLDDFDIRLETLQQQMVQTHLKVESASEYLRLSMQAQSLRRSSLKNEQVFYQLAHSSLAFITPQEARLFKDIYDHVVRVVDISDHYQQSLREVLNLQYSLNNTKVNEVLLFLTLLATISLPLNLLTGIYGMNFLWMPFLNDSYGFWIIFSLMLGAIVAMFIHFKRRQWL
ncbi:MAG: magnesium/cobalt transporter CorA [Vampirovibrionales bacterium]|nr:magnesium/cobalt transporter CorA [Vampirovibrionales bacterium]